LPYTLPTLYFAQILSNLAPFQADSDSLNLQGDYPVSNNLLNKSVVRTEKLTKKKIGWFHHIAYIVF